MNKSIRKHAVIFCFLIFAVFPKVVFGNSSNQSCGYDMAGWLLPQDAGVHVSVSGNDTGSCGTHDNPCRTITKGLEKAVSGDAVWVHAGKYNESNLKIPAGVSLISADGPLMAEIFSGSESAVRFTNVSGASIDGFNIYGQWNSGAGDGLVRVLNANNIKIRNSMIHDAPHDQDCVKVSGHVNGLLLERLIIWNPGMRETGTYQENIDIYGSDGTIDGVASVRDVTLRGSWLFHTKEIGGKSLVYAKVSVSNIIYEDNIFGPAETISSESPSVNAGGYSTDPKNPGGFTGWDFIVRNNIFVSLGGDGGFGISNTDNVWVYGNTFYNNSGLKVRSVIQLRGNARQLGAVNIFGNIFLSNNPQYKGGIFYRVRDGGTPANLFKGYNLYFNNISETSLAYTNESGSIYNEDPLLSMPHTPSINPLPTELDVIDEIKANFKAVLNSPVVDVGLNAVSRNGHPSWSTDATRRCDSFQHPRDDKWDLGIHEAQGQDFIPPNAPTGLRIHQ